MSQTQTIEKLRAETLKNPIINASMHMLALRKRTRQELSLDALYHAMKAEGYMYARHQYLPLLKLLSDLELGVLMTDEKGRINALKDITSTLQSIGQVACGDKGVVLKTFQSKRGVKKGAPPAVQAPKTSNVAITLSVTLRTNVVSMVIPPGLSDDEVSLLVCKFRNGGAA